MIVLNEVLYAEEWLEKDVPWKKAGHVLYYVAKYYFYKGYSKDDVREKLNEYIEDNMDLHHRVRIMTFKTQDLDDLVGCG